MKNYQLVRVRLAETPVGKQLCKEIISEHININDAQKYAINLYKDLGILRQQLSIFDYYKSGDWLYQLRTIDVLKAETIKIDKED